METDTSGEKNEEAVVSMNPTFLFPFCPVYEIASPRDYGTNKEKPPYYPTRILLSLYFFSIFSDLQGLRVNILSSNAEGTFNAFFKWQ